MLKLLKNKTKEEVIDSAVFNLLHTLQQYDFTHSDRAEVIRIVSENLKKQREEILNDIINANSI